jgi:hypothetical protein
MERVGLLEFVDGRWLYGWSLYVWNDRNLHRDNHNGKRLGGHDGKQWLVLLGEWSDDHGRHDHANRHHHNNRNACRYDGFWRCDQLRLPGVLGGTGGDLARLLPDELQLPSRWGLGMVITAFFGASSTWEA